jgi:hypothetical protein
LEILLGVSLVCIFTLNTAAISITEAFITQTFTIFFLATAFLAHASFVIVVVV